MHEVVEAVYERQIGEIIPVYKRRRDAMLAALAEHMPAGVSWTKPQGGMFVWLTLPAATDSVALLARSIAEERVAFVPGGAFFVDGSGRNTIRLSYSLPPESGIEEGIKRLGRLVGKVMAAR
jgi:DNA-binding transcriptional MocR family regulator